ncbi:MAG: pentapeptide repeat-containing protein [Planctomycetota bacterium]
MIKEPGTAVTAAFRRFAESLDVPFEAIQWRAGSESKLLPSFNLGDIRVILLALEPGVAQDPFRKAFKKASSEALATDPAYEVVAISTENHLSAPRLVIDRGVSLVPLHSGIMRILNFPSDWLPSQRATLEKALLSVTVNGEVRLATLYATEANDRLEAQFVLRSILSSWDRHGEAIDYFRAEAGKGKTTVLAHAAFEQMVAAEGPLPVFIPLRRVQRGHGVSWAELCASIGFLGSSASRAAAAVRAGLVTLILDGLDEVAGRYDPVVVQGVLDAVSTELRSAFSRVLISGRTTEATLLKPGLARVRGLDLPEGHEEAFLDYARLVVSDVTPRWPALATRVPEPPISLTSLRDGAPTEKEKATIVEWLQYVFEDLGKERSLFFVQSLACLGRSLQLDGNQPLVIHQESGDVKLARRALYDVSILATALACIREQDKVEDLAREWFLPARQIELLMLYSLMASAQSSIAGLLPTPNEAAGRVFAIDPVNQNEEFTAILRQMQKHAFLFAVSGDGLHAGDWRPLFLSDWVRCALLYRAWLNRDALVAFVKDEIVAQAVARAERARIAYESLIPELVALGRVDDLDDLVTALVVGVAEESPEAAGNFWALRAGLAGQTEVSLPEGTLGLVPFTDLSDLAFEGLDFDATFAGSLAVLVESQFTSCNLRRVTLAQCDLTNASFVRCSFDGVAFEHCDGPIFFEDCLFRQSRFFNARAGRLPAYGFTNCRFEAGCSIHQESLVAPNLFGAVAEFENSICEDDPGELLGGDVIGMAQVPPRGLQAAGQVSTASADEACLRALLKPFFPRGAGTPDTIQARGYIRASAVGRGVFPEGSPSDRELRSILHAFGFTSGGRQGHIYAPWSSMAGAGPEAFRLRNELVAFVQTGTQGTSVTQMLDRIRQRGNWR